MGCAKFGPGAPRAGMNYFLLSYMIPRAFMHSNARSNSRSSIRRLPEKLLVYGGAHGVHGPVDAGTHPEHLLGQWREPFVCLGPRARMRAFDPEGEHIWGIVTTTLEVCSCTSFQDAAPLLLLQEPSRPKNHCHEQPACGGGGSPIQKTSAHARFFQGSDREGLCAVLSFKGLGSWHHHPDNTPD